MRKWIFVALVIFIIWAMNEVKEALHALGLL